MCKLEKLEAGGKTKRKAPMQSMAEQLEGSVVNKHSKEPLHIELLEQAV